MASIAIGTVYTGLNVINVATDLLEHTTDKFIDTVNKIKDYLHYSSYFNSFLALCYAVSLNPYDLGNVLEILTTGLTSLAFVSAIFLGISYLTVKTINYATKFFDKKPDKDLEEITKTLPEKLRKNIHIEYKKPNFIKNEQIALLAGIITNVFLLTSPFFSYLYLVNIGLITIKLITLNTEKWVKLKYNLNTSIPIYKEHGFGIATFVNQLSINYFIRLKKSFSSVKENCAVCLEDTKSKYYFCKDHVFHIPCILGSAVAKIKDFSLENLKNITKHIEYSSSGYVKDQYYDIALKEGSTPTCPMCRKKSLNEKFKINVKDTSTTRWLSSNVSFS
ncbi:MAG: hypothetical protein KR126chlam6_00020 [Candidatus Anoxychlamydiales bacterium]|nr:hypothetical protein [Candidatus Anoxychlamydiales bacterium]